MAQRRPTSTVNARSTRDVNARRRAVQGGRRWPTNHRRTLGALYVP
jgi:hypothetical protein